MLNNKKEAVKENLSKNIIGITEHNKIIEGRGRLSLLEQKFIILMTTIIKSEDTDLPFIRIKASDIGKALDLNPKTMYRKIYSFVDELNKKEIIIPKPDGDLKALWVSSCERIHSTSEIEFEFSAKLKPYLLEINENFTFYQYDMIRKMRSLYSIRIYRLLKQYEKIKRRYFEYSEIRAMLGIEDHEYPLFGNFNQKVLKRARADIDTFTDLTINDIQFEKSGRKVTAIKFFFSTKEKAFVEKKEIPLSPIIQSMFDEFSMKTKCNKISSKVINDILLNRWNFIKQSESLLLKKEMTFEDYLKYKIEYVLTQASKKKIRNMTGFLIDSIKENYGGTKKHADKKIKEIRNSKNKELEILTYELNDLNASKDKYVTDNVMELFENKNIDIETVFSKVNNIKSQVRNYSGLSNIEMYEKSLIIRVVVNSYIVENNITYFPKLKDHNVKIAKIEKKMDKIKRSL